VVGWVHALTLSLRWRKCRCLWVHSTWGRGWCVHPWECKWSCCPGGPRVLVVPRPPVQLRAQVAVACSNKLLLILSPSSCHRHRSRRDTKRPLTGQVGLWHEVARSSHHLLGVLGTVPSLSTRRWWRRSTALVQGHPARMGGMVTNAWDGCGATGHGRQNDLAGSGAIDAPHAEEVLDENRGRGRVRLVRVLAVML